MYSMVGDAPGTCESLVGDFRGDVSRFNVPEIVAAAAPRNFNGVLGGLSACGAHCAEEQGKGDGRRGTACCGRFCVRRTMCALRLGMMNEKHEL